MKILYIHQYFRTPDEGGCTRSYELAKGLVERGHEVTMITAHNQRRGIQNIDKIQVHYLPVRYKNEFGFIKRIFAFLWFVRLAKREIRKMEEIEMAYVMTTPLTSGLIALYIKIRLGIPYFFEVGDLWPKAPIEMGVIRNAWLIKKLYQFEARCYEHAKKVIALSPAIQQYVQQVAPEVETHVITNLSDCSFYQIKSTRNKVFQIGYFGTFGQANDILKFIQLAKTCESRDSPIHFTLMGEGSEEQKLKNTSQDLENITILRFGNKEKVRRGMEKMDAIYIAYKNLPVLTTGSPNKLFDGLAAGKLIIINFKGWIKELIESNACGFSHDPQQPQAFIEQLTPFLEDRKLLSTYQKNSRQLAEKQFEKEKLIKKLDEIISP